MPVLIQLTMLVRVQPETKVECMISASHEYEARFGMRVQINKGVESYYKF